MPDPSILYCCDEDIAVRDSGNYPGLTPDDQLIASGSDGVILSGSPWVLTSASAGFVAAGVAKGHVVSLDGPDFPFGPSGVRLAVESCTATTLTLRRLGFAASAGQPPGPATAIDYAIRTLGPQIADASYDLNRRFGIDDNFATKSASYLYDARELRQATVLTVLVRQYTSESRTQAGDWSAKRDLARADLDDLIGRLTVKWGPLGLGQPPTNRLSTRITR